MGHASPKAPVRVRVPATSANCGPGFDTLGLALSFYNHFDAQPAEAMSLVIAPGTCVDVSGVSLDPADNLLAQSYVAYFGFRQQPVIPAQLSIEAHIPLQRGLGSSSSAIVGGLMLANAMSADPLPTDALVPMAVELEGHPDNVVPALLGGVRCSFMDNQSALLPWPEAWSFLVVIPDTPVSTHEARKVLPSEYARADVIETVQGMAAWIHAVHTGESTWLRKALGMDRVHQPYRGRLIPPWAQLQSLVADRDGVIGCAISGSGSTMLVITETPEGIAPLKEYLTPQLKGCRVLALGLNTQGAVLV